jgi:hypothetical protein
MQTLHRYNNEYFSIYHSLRYFGVHYWDAIRCKRIMGI